MNMILTNKGEELASNGFLTGVFPKVTKVVFGDGNGVSVTPNKSMTALVRSIQEGVGTTIVKLANPNRLYIYTQIPTSIGGITLREVGLFTEDNILIAVGGNFTKVKPPITESTEKFDLYITIPISSSQEITVEFSNDNLYASQDNIDLIANAEEDNRVAIQDIILNKMPTKVNYTDVVNTLTSTLTNRPLSALQGKVLKGMIDNINTLLLSDNTTLDSMQEVVDFIEANRTTLNTLSIPNIAGLENALTSKLNASVYTPVDVLTKIKTVDGHGSGLDADLVDGYEGAYLAGLAHGGSTIDPNIAIYPYILTNHSNSPNPSVYWHIRTQFYATISATSNVAQIAIQYNSGNQVWARSRASNIWTPWVRLDNNGISGGASTIVTSNLTASRALVSDANGKVAVSAVTSAEVGYLDGVTSNIQYQFNNEVVHNLGVVAVQAVVGDGKLCTTAQFVSWLVSIGAFNYSQCKFICSWSYASNNMISDVLGGTLHTAGCIIELSCNSTLQYTIKVTSPNASTTSIPGGGIHIYNNNGPEYLPGWRRVYTSMLNDSVGVNQTWQDVTASRATNVTYTNSTGKPMFIIVNTSYNGGVILHCNGINIAYASYGGGAFPNPATAVIPNNATYGVSSGSLFSRWVELR